MASMGKKTAPSRVECSGSERASPNVTLKCSKKVNPILQHGVDKDVACRLLGCGGKFTRKAQRVHPRLAADSVEALNWDFNHVCIGTHGTVAADGICHRLSSPCWNRPTTVPTTNNS